MAEGHFHAHAGAHRHGDTHAHPTVGRVLGTALAVTLGYAVVEVVAGFAFGSLALVSDAGHMVSDAMALGLAWFAAWVSARPSGARHSYGLARAEVIAAFVNGLALLLVVVLIAVEAISRLLHTTPVDGIGVMVVAFVGLLLNLAVVLILSRGERGLNLRAVMLHVVADVVGSVAALASGAVIYFTGWKPVDPILSLVIALLILGSTVQLLREALHVLMEGVPRSMRLEEVGRVLAGIEGVRSVHDLHIWDISAGRPALSAHMNVSDLAAWPAILEQARQLLHRRFGIDHITLQPEVGAGSGPKVIKILGRT
ncbi:MAG TPA: cation diffusion facilitator family transporter [Burkholderiales bacterium]|nr:cation diffusion facilitator family transporter [Burkholderiales bacterium]